MAEARYLRKMKREHKGSSPFDPRKVAAFSGRNLPVYPDVEKEATIPTVLGLARAPLASAG